ncbi:MAG: SgcJ/EcaC family oxidoreductase [Flavisolibacter sp.]|nr:SgcJ/EcaC family oxidoreductase [Flavisolibacter sp.]MBD0288995.1 SgcJ/EcaC family oxidoreductase [Flavisolibacter sp.]MBD0294068.1 SgcJ/EcaC family oxidoreductase [Flavisolibacter sp.]MBD0349594.1 SgcJ/EcaC family oxidoreductase [Flavisolibacter sp.]MBD0374872.1 SgcJ/EcaC family oxidoreductase [Flavisolibacter sp.]
MNSPEQDQLAVLKLHEEVIESFNARDAEKLLSLHTDDIILMEQNIPALIGKQEVRKLFEKLETGMIDFTLAFTIQEIQILGEKAFVRGQVIKTTLQEGQPVQVTGKFITLSQKQKDGRWLRTHVMSNSDAPAAMH